MSNGNNLIQLESGDGESIACQILDIFEFMNKEYALLLKVHDESLVIMRMVVKDGGSVFQTIENDEEFERVIQFIQTIAKTTEEDRDRSESSDRSSDSLS